MAGVAIPLGVMSDWVSVIEKYNGLTCCDPSRGDERHGSLEKVERQEALRSL